MRRSSVPGAELRAGIPRDSARGGIRPGGARRVVVRVLRARGPVLVGLRLIGRIVAGLFLAGLNLLGLIPQEASRPSVVAER